MVSQKLLDVFNSKYNEKRRLTLEERVEEVVEEFGSRLDWDRDFKTCIWLFIFYSSNIYLSLKKNWYFSVECMLWSVFANNRLNTFIRLLNYGLSQNCNIHGFFFKKIYISSCNHSLHSILWGTIQFSEFFYFFKKYKFISKLFLK